MTDLFSNQELDLWIPYLVLNTSLIGALVVLIKVNNQSAKRNLTLLTLAIATIAFIFIVDKY